MYVSRLDRPWLETSFLIQGGLIQSAEDILALGKQCSYVYVDTEKGYTPDPNFWLLANENELNLAAGNSSGVQKNTTNEYEKYRQCVYETTVELEEELTQSRLIFEDVGERTLNVFHALKSNKKLDLLSLKEGVKSTVNSIIRNPSAMTLLVQLRRSDDYSYSHALGTSVWCAQFGRHLGLNLQDIKTLSLGGLLLDIGKLKLPQGLISQADKYGSNEMRAMKYHVSLGINILQQCEGIDPELLQMVATHHERADGSGYQSGLSNDKIPLFGRIAGIVDSYDAMTSKRIYIENTFTPHEAMNELYKMRGQQFQAELVEQFIQTVGLYPTGSLVELNTGEVGVITEINALKRLYPTVMLLLDSSKCSYDEFTTVDLSEVSGMQVVKGVDPDAYGIKMNELFL